LPDTFLRSGRLRRASGNLPASILRTIGASEALCVRVCLGGWGAGIVTLLPADDDDVLGEPLPPEERTADQDRREVERT